MIKYKICCDVLVIGTEGTGARAALEASAHGARVLAITKGLPAHSGATLTAGGEISIDSRSARELFGVNGSPDDNPEQFARDMIREGEYLADQRLVAIHTAEAPARVKELVEWGCRLEGFIQGPGHTYPRGIWIPGRKISRLLVRRLGSAGVPVLANTMVLEFMRDDEGVVGALALDLATGRLIVIQSRVVILATGGAMRVFPLITAPEELTGDGMAMALRCGAGLQDMEFPMFLPYCFVTPPALCGVTFSYDMSAMLDVHALNRYGERYMVHWDAQRMEHSTRDINAVAAAMEIQAGRGSRAGGTYLSFAHLPSSLVHFSAEWFPDNLRGWRAYGFNLHDFFSDLGTDAWECAPACHFWNGGIRINERCETEVPGLFAAGEGTAGIHGANRLSGNGLTMTQVWGKRAGFYACEFLSKAKLREPDPAQIAEVIDKVKRLQSPGSGPSVIEFRREIRRVAGELVGIVREQKRLNQAVSAIASLRRDLPRQHVHGQDPCFNREWIEGLQNENQLDVVEAIVRASLARHESRGAMYRTDFPYTDDECNLHNIVLRRQGVNWTLEELPVMEDYVSLPRGKRQYGRKGD
jgi:succinate dehydrogenase / fumarate reductase flavoprotein subunit/fumarate reductase (CoM/CoB) subunit A